MKLRLIYPKFKKFLEDHRSLREELKDHVIGDYTMPPSLALPIVAALTPDSIDVALTDDNISPVDFDEKIDLVVISCFTPQAQRAYEIADGFRRRGTKTVIGGIHPTAMADEALLHADSVCVGEAELVWSDILKDAAQGSLKKRYQAGSYYDLSKIGTHVSAMPKETWSSTTAWTRWRRMSMIIRCPNSRERWSPAVL